MAAQDTFCGRSFVDTSMSEWTDGLAPRSRSQPRYEVGFGHQTGLIGLGPLRIFSAVTSQGEFQFPDGPEPSMHPPDPRAGFYREVTAVWHLPLGERVRVLLRGHDFPEAAGHLELVRAPGLPLNAHEPLQLTAGSIAFVSTQVEAWSLLD